ncbi:MAG: hypothetical protein U1F43_32950 [Myxococcota bacterium]
MPHARQWAATLKVRTDRFLAGGQAFGVPPPLQPLLGQVRSMSGNIAGEDFGFRDSFAVFVETLVTGMSFTNHDMGPHVLGFPMPADVYRNMTIEDKEAVYTYLWIIQDFGLVPNDSPHQMPARYCATVDDCEAGESAAVTVGSAPTHECAGSAMRQRRRLRRVPDLRQRHRSASPRRPTRSAC